MVCMKKFAAPQAKKGVAMLYRSAPLEGTGTLCTCAHRGAGQSAGEFTTWNDFWQVKPTAAQHKEAGGVQRMRVHSFFCVLTILLASAKEGC